MVFNYNGIFDKHSLVTVLCGTLTYTWRMLTQLLYINNTTRTVRLQCTICRGFFGSLSLIFPRPWVNVVRTQSQKYELIQRCAYLIMPIIHHCTLLKKSSEKHVEQVLSTSKVTDKSSKCMYVNGLIKGAMQESYQSNWYKITDWQEKMFFKKLYFILYTNLKKY